MKIAYIVVCHKDPQLLSRLANTLKFENDHFFVHVDQKSDLEPFAEACRNTDNITFMRNRLPNYWGGWNSIAATMNTLAYARAAGPFDRYILLQGQDYPLVSPDRIHSFLEEHKDEEFCRGVDISYSSDRGDYMKVCAYYLYDYSRKNLFLRFAGTALFAFNSLGIRYRSPVFKSGNETWHIYHGWAQWTLSDKAAEYMLDFYHKRDDFNSYIRHRFPPDELYFATVMNNSEFKGRISKHTIISRKGKETYLNLTYFEYPSTVVTFTDESVLDSLLKTNALFVRKVSSESSQTLLDAIDSRIASEQ